jgi:MFS family permease
MLGRKKTIFIGSCIMVVGAAIQASSFSLGQLISSRFITGFGNGKNDSIPLWRAALTNTRYEYIDRPDMAVRVIKIPSAWTDGYDWR